MPRARKTAASPPAPQFEMRAAEASDLSRIESLMQYYNYESSEWFPLRFSESGNYLLPSKHKYWKRPGVFPFLIRVDGELAGFVVVDDQVVHATSRYNLGYLFVARRFRRRGIGANIARQLFDQFKGPWEIHFVSMNAAAESFLAKVTAELGIGDLDVSEQERDGAGGILYRFSTGAAPDEPAPG